MLFVHDRQRQFGEDDRLLKQRVGADRDLHRAAGQSLQRQPPGLAGQSPGQPGHFDSQRFQPGSQVAVVLFRQQFGGGHQRRLGTVFHRPQRGGGGHHGLAGADIALQQPQHGPRLGQVGGDFRQHPLLGDGKRKGQPLHEALA